QLGTALGTTPPDNDQRNFPVKVKKDATGNDLDSVEAVSAGEAHSLALKNDGTVWAWGNNNNKQLGVGFSSDTDVPTQVVASTQQGDFLVEVQSIDAGNNYNLALKNDGTVWAWGRNASRQLGDGSDEAARSTPVQVSGLSDVQAISAGEGHSLALKNDGTVWAWGRNSSGQLGGGSTTISGRSTPAQVSGLSDVQAISAGEDHSLALKNDGTVWAWGRNASRQLGDGSDEAARSTPVQVSGLSVVQAISAGGEHSLALKSDGTVWAWGKNNVNQLGIAGGGDRSEPVQVPELLGVTAIAASDLHSLAIKPDNITGRVTSLVGEGRRDTKVALDIAGNFIEEATTNSQGYYAFGTAVGNGSYNVTPTTPGITFSPASSSVSGFSGNVQINFVAVEGSTINISGVVQDRNSHPLSGTTVTLAYGQEQESVQTDINGQYSFSKPQGPVYRVSPSAENYDFEPRTREITNLGPNESVNFIGGLLNFSEEVTENQNIVWAWGSNSDYKLGYNTRGGKSTVAAQVSSLVGVLAVAGAGENHSISRTRNNTVLSWGNNQDSQLGNPNLVGGQRYRSITPVQVGGLDNTLSNITAIAAGFKHNLALKNDNTVVGWGKNSDGALGDGTRDNRQSPVPVQNLDDVGAVSAGNHSLALKNDGTVWAWGNNNYNALGVTQYPRSEEGSLRVPHQVAALTGIGKITAGFHHSLALKNDGTVWAWGRNDFGQLGLGDDKNTLPGVQNGVITPAQVSGLSDAGHLGGRRSQLGAQKRRHRLGLGPQQLRPTR
ncbi:MAG: carboxypeptidase regulatory-like domain-containing protein, partial [Pyrinomonadaceae bacterium]